MNMNYIYNTSTFIGAFLLVLIILTIAIQVIGSFVGLALGYGLDYFLPISYIALSLIIAPVVHRKVFKSSE